jgi:hypothetical protein
LFYSGLVSNTCRSRKLCVVKVALVSCSGKWFAFIEMRREDSNDIKKLYRLILFCSNPDAFCSIEFIAHPARLKNCEYHKITRHKTSSFMRKNDRFQIEVIEKERAISLKNTIFNERTEMLYVFFERKANVRTQFLFGS